MVLKVALIYSAVLEIYSEIYLEKDFTEKELALKEVLTLSMI